MFPLPGAFQAAVFDMDGLLIDSEPLWGRAEAALVEAHGGRLTRADRLATIGRSIDASIAIHAERLGLPPSILPDLRRELIGTVRELYTTEGEIRPGAAELIDRLTGRLPVGLASNSDRDLVDLALARIGLDGRFRSIVTAGDVDRAKPAPDPYLELCRRLGVEPSRAIGFEDSPSGVEALRAAGISAVGVRAGGPLDLDAADVVVDSLVEVLDWFDSA
jgi:HAD superfamily hydrolase (TIGR01509 family)